MLQADLSSMPGGVVREFNKLREQRNRKALETAQAEQTATAQEVAGEHRSVNGLGKPDMAVTSTAFHYWGRREGYGCWNDKSFRNEFKRDNPGVRIKSGGTRVTSSCCHVPDENWPFRKKKYPPRHRAHRDETE